MNRQDHVTFAGPSFEAARVSTQRERFLGEMERAVPWEDLRTLVEPVYAGAVGHRPRPLESERMLRIYFLQHWFRLSDRAVREELFDSSAMRGFVCIGTDRAAVPAEAAIGRFGQLMGEYGLGQAILAAASRYLQARGLAVAPGAIVDAALIDARAFAPAAPRKQEAMT